jgi:hypothetical protein
MLKYIKIILFLKIIFKINVSKQFKTYKKINFYFFKKEFLYSTVSPHFQTVIQNIETKQHFSFVEGKR